jgi:hypothetical protein
MMIWHALHPFPDGTWTWSIILICLIRSSYPSFASVSSLTPYVNPGNCFKMSNLIILLSHPIHPCPGRTSTWTWLFEYPSSDHPIASSSSVFRTYVNLVNCLKMSNLIILFHPPHPSSERKSTWSIFWIPLIWSSYPPSLASTSTWSIDFTYPSSDHPFFSSSSVSRKYVDLVNCFKMSNLIILSHHLPPWLRLQPVREPGQLFLKWLI